MDWDLYWNTVWQIGIACVILAFPISVVAFFLSSAISSGYHSKSEKSNDTVERDTL